MTKIEKGKEKKRRESADHGGQSSGSSSASHPRDKSTPGPVTLHAEKESANGESVSPETHSNAPPSPAQQLATLEAALLRAKADYQNLQRRTAQEKSEAIRYANVELMRALVEVLDDFDRAFEALASSDADQGTTQGIRLVHDNFVRAMTGFGMEKIEALGKPFDPHLHQALLHEPSTEFEPGTVIQEIAKGYRLGDRIVRPAKVVVAKQPD